MQCLAVDLNVQTRVYGYLENPVDIAEFSMCLARCRQPVAQALPAESSSSCSSRLFSASPLYGKPLTRSAITAYTNCKCQIQSVYVFPQSRCGMTYIRSSIEPLILLEGAAISLSFLTPRQRKSIPDRVYCTAYWRIYTLLGINFMILVDIIPGKV